MRHQGFPTNLKGRVAKYFDYLWSRQHGLDEISILNDLPVALRLEVAAFVNGLEAVFRRELLLEDMARI